MRKAKINKENNREDTKVITGPLSVYADLGLKDYEEMETKANLVIEISKAIKKKNLHKHKPLKCLASPNL